MTVAAKICGLAEDDAVAAAVAGGAAYVGFVFYPPSPRSVSRQQAARLCAAVPPGVTRVGLFVDADDHSITAVLDMAPLDMLQFHGHESPQRVAEAKARFQCKVMKAVAIAGPDDLAAAADYEDVADMLLFDAKPPIRPDALPGGNGLAFDWGLIAGRFVAASMDAVGGPDRRIIAGGGARLGGSDRRRVLRRRNPAGA